MKNLKLWSVLALFEIIFICGMSDLSSAQNNPQMRCNGGPANCSAGSVSAFFDGFSIKSATAAQLRAGFGNVTANFVLSGPVSGGSAAPVFRALVGADLPNPSAASLGGIQSYANVSHQWLNAISTLGVPSSSQPACADLSNGAASCSSDTTNAANISSGTLNSARLPNPSASTLGGIESFAAVSHSWINSISTLGVPSGSQPDFADLSGSLAAAQVATGTITGQTAQPAVDANNDFLFYYSAADNAVRKATPGQIASSGAAGVSSFNGRIGVVLPASGDYSYSLLSGGIPSATAFAGSLLGTAIAAPSTPAAGIGSVYIDSTSKVLSLKNDAGTVTHGAQTTASTGSQWLNALNADGSFTKAQPAFTDISGSLAGGQTPAYTGDVTKSAGATATVLANIPNDVPQAGDILVTNTAAPATPASGKSRVYVDSTGKVLSAINDAGTVSHGVQTAAAVSHQFVTAISAAGAVSQAQPATGDLAAIGANTVLANATAGSAAPAAVSVPSCTDSGGNHLNYTNASGFSCGTSGPVASYAMTSVAAASQSTINFTNLNGSDAIVIIDAVQTSSNSTPTVAFSSDNCVTMSTTVSFNGQLNSTALRWSGVHLTGLKAGYILGQTLLVAATATNLNTTPVSLAAVALANVTQIEYFPGVQINCLQIGLSGGNFGTVGNIRVGIK